MKKSRLFLAAVASLALTGCSIQDLMFWKKDKGGEEQQKEEEAQKKNWELEPEITGGSEEVRNAILDALNNKPICTQTGSKTDEIYYDVEKTLNEDEGDGVKLTTSQVSGGKTVAITWSIDETQTYFGKLLHADEAHDLIEVNYQGYGKEDGKLSWTLVKMECEDAVANVNLVYTVNIHNEEYLHEDMTIAEIYSITDSEMIVDAGGTEHKFASTFDLVDYSYKGGTYSPYFKTNNPDAKEKQYYYVNVPGKVLYTAPDGNWGLLADGKNVLEFYAGSSARPFLETSWPNLANKYVKISGNLGQYTGNVQLTYVTKIGALTEAEKAAITEPEPVTYRELDETLLASLKVAGYTAQKQAVLLSDGTCLSNSLGQVTGTFKEGSLKNSKNAAVNNIDNMKNGERYTFVLTVGSEEMTVAYDYHTDKDGSVGVMSALKTALKAGGEMTIKGTVRYAGNNNLPFITEGNNGVWNIVPYLPAHIG